MPIDISERINKTKRKIKSSYFEYQRERSEKLFFNFFTK